MRKKPKRKALSVHPIGNGLYREIQDFPAEHDYPRALSIGNALYTVSFVNKMKGCLGQCSGASKLILISRDQDAAEMLATYFHEVMHAWEFELGVKLGHPMIRKLEYAIVGVLLQFPVRVKKD